MEKLLRIRDNHMLWTVSIFMVLFAVFLYLKPSLAFTEDGKIKPFGVKKSGSTIFPVWLWTFVFAVFSRIIVTLLSCNEV